MLDPENPTPETKRRLKALMVDQCKLLVQYLKNGESQAGATAKAIEGAIVKAYSMALSDAAQVARMTMIEFIDKQDT